MRARKWILDQQFISVFTRSRMISVLKYANIISAYPTEPEYVSKEIKPLAYYIQETFNPIVCSTDDEQDVSTPADSAHSNLQNSSNTCENDTQCNAQYKSGFPTHDKSCRRRSDKDSLMGNQDDSAQPGFSSDQEPTGPRVIDAEAVHKGAKSQRQHDRADVSGELRNTRQNKGYQTLCDNPRERKTWGEKRYLGGR